MMSGRVAVSVITCVPAPGISNVIVSGPGLAFASIMACRKEPMPLSFVLTTTMGASGARVFIVHFASADLKGRSLRAALACAGRCISNVLSIENNPIKKSMNAIKVRSDLRIEAVEAGALFIGFLRRKLLMQFQ